MSTPVFLHPLILSKLMSTLLKHELLTNMAPQSPMADWITEVNPDDVIFLQKLQESANSAVFKVAVHGRICVMKVVSALYLFWMSKLNAF